MCESEAVPAECKKTIFYKIDFLKNKTVFYLFFVYGLPQLLGVCRSGGAGGTCIDQ